MTRAVQADTRADNGAAAVPPARPAVSKGWGLPLAVLIVGMFMSVLDVTIVNVAIPSIQQGFGGSIVDTQWIATAYTLALGVVVPLSSWLGDRFGLTRVYIASLLGFAAGSALCGLAWDLNSLIVFRIIQAVPGGILPVITLTIVYKIVPREKIGAAMGMYGLGIVFAPAVGPVLGGYLVEYQDWRWIFFVNVPIGLAGAAAAVVVLARIAPSARRRLDMLGFGTVGFGLASVLLAFSKGEDWGWTSYPTLLWLTAGLFSLALFVVIELEVEHPLLDMRVFRYWPFTNSLLLLMVLQVGLFAVLFYVTVFLQQGQGLTALNAGLRVLPQALVVGVMMPIAGRLYDKIGPRWLVAVGFAISAYGSYLLAGINPDMTEGELIWWTCVRSAGMGLAMIPIMTAGIASLPAEKVNQGSALNNVTRQVAGALGLAVFSALATGQQAQLLADRSALVSSANLGQLPSSGSAPATGQNLFGMYGLMQRTRLEVLGSAYGNIFLIITVMTLAGVALALLLRSGPAVAAPHTPPAPPSRRTSDEQPGQVSARPIASAVEQPQTREPVATSR